MNSWTGKLVSCVAILAALLWAAPATAATPALGPVVVVAFENHPYSAVVGSPSMPYLNSLIRGNALAANYYATAPGSVPDYFMLTTGNTVSCCTSYTGPYSGDNLARELIKGGKSWKIYAQSLPYAGYLGTGYYPYVKYHNPFAYFTDVINSTAQVSKIMPFPQLSADIANGTLPAFSMVIPDNRHNAHDCPAGGTNCTDADKLQAADLFLQDFVPALLTVPSFQQSGLLVIWWDEGNSTSERTAIALVGPLVKKGFASSTAYKDQNLLRTIVEGLRLAAFPGASATAYDMGDMFTGGSTSGGGTGGGSCTASAVGVTICAPAAGATVTSPVSIAAAASGTHSIVAMKAYLDSQQVAASSSGSLTASVTAGSGSHSLVVNAWDSAGVLYQAKETFSVGSTTSGGGTGGGGSCTAASGVTICSPAAGATVSSPFSISAAASGTHTIVAMKAYLDYQQVAASSSGSLTASGTAGSGSHSLIVNAWDSAGVLYQAKETFSVQ